MCSCKSLSLIYLFRHPDQGIKKNVNVCDFRIDKYGDRRYCLPMTDMLPIALAAPELMTALEMNVAIQQPCMVWGPPGIGKSMVMAQLAEKLGIALKDVRAMLMNPVDVNGMPHRRFGHEAIMKLQRLSQVLDAQVVNFNEVKSIVSELSPQAKLDAITKMLSDAKGTFKDWDKIRDVVGDTADDYFGESIWARPGILPKVGSGILFFDEINAAGPDVQAAMYQPILDRRIGDHLLAAGWVIMCAGNRMNDKGRVQPMPTPLKDRLQHYYMAVEWEAWEQWAKDTGIHPLVIAYLKFTMGRQYEEKDRCGMLHFFNTKDDSFPTPRSWAKVSRAIQEMEDRNLIGTQIEQATIAGKVGREAAVELIDFATMYREGLSMPAIMMNPDTVVVPSQPAMKCAISAALARNASKQNLDIIWKYMVRMEAEYQMMFFKHGLRLHPELHEHHTFTDFFAANEKEMA